MNATKLTAPLCALLVCLPLGARADRCPPEGVTLDDWGWRKGNVTGDNWITAEICSSNARRVAARDLVVDNMGLFDDWDEWGPIVGQAANCGPNSWGSRLVNAGWVADKIGDVRDNDSFNHFATATAVLPNGTTVGKWLSQYVRYYQRDVGFDFECLGSDDSPGSGDGYLYGSNPAVGATNLFYPWFWNKNAVDRASTVVHESTHEFVGHLDDDECDNGGSCDTAFMDANAQSFQILFDAQAVDAYQLEPGSRELAIVNFGSDVCGYLPFLPDQDRFALVATIRDKLSTVFKYEPSQNQWPAAAFIDNVSDVIYDAAAQPDGESGKAYRIDITNAARWPCGQVCRVEDYRFNPDGNSGPKACNETWQPGNAQVNATNRDRCAGLNAEVDAGVTPEEHSVLRGAALNGAMGCIPGVSAEYLAQVCDEAMVGARTIEDVANAWSLPQDIGYGYDAESAIEACQLRFCDGARTIAWDRPSQTLCYEWDDPAGCMPLLCGDLEALAESDGRESIEYLMAVVCRASELGRDVGFRPSDIGCEAVYNDCVVRDQLLPLWQAQLAGGPCWSSDADPNDDPLQHEQRQGVGVLSTDRFVSQAQNAGLLAATCILEEAQCEALEALMAAVMAKVADMRFQQRPTDRGPPLPDPWEQLAGRFDREVDVALRELGRELNNGDPQGFLSRDARIQKLVSTPGARVATAELIGRDTYLRIGGARFAEGVFSPEVLTKYGPDGEHDPYGVSIEGMEAEVAALETLAGRTNSRTWQAQMNLAPRLGGARYYEHMVNILAAPTATALLDANDALAQDIASLAR